MKCVHCGVEMTAEHGFCTSCGKAAEAHSPDGGGLGLPVTGLVLVILGIFAGNVALKIMELPDAKGSALGVAMAVLVVSALVLVAGTVCSAAAAGRGRVKGFETALGGLTLGGLALIWWGASFVYGLLT